MDIKFIKREELQEKPDQKKLGFGKYFADYMFTMDYDEGIGWHDATIRPYGPIEMNPATVVLHYAQETFEGLKAYRRADGQIQLFRPEMNARRMINSNERLCMATIPEDMFIEAVNALVKAEEDWVPSEPETSLYIRPFAFACESSLGVHKSKAYKFVIILSPVGAYYAEGLAPVKIMVEDEYVRAVQGGTGFTKCGGNYAGSIIGQVKAEKYGCSQVLWLDGRERKICRRSWCNEHYVQDRWRNLHSSDRRNSTSWCNQRFYHSYPERLGIQVNETHLSVDDLMQAGRDGRLEEVYGTGTAAVISPVGALVYKGEEITINNFKIGELTQKLYDYLTGIQWGKEEDKYGWTRLVK